ncbi:MAG: hypothetical protein Q8N18_15845 [Opitutaceae bacterium]|nr:hypothetical protein [Opitutaceae bacterium]
MKSTRSSCLPLLFRFRLLPLALAALLTLGLAGCVGFMGQRQRHHEASSVVQFLYPDKNQPFVQPRIPTLRLPLRVGLAFVPSGTAGGRTGH